MSSYVPCNACSVRSRAWCAKCGGDGWVSEKPPRCRARKSGNRCTKILGHAGEHSALAPSSPSPGYAVFIDG